MKKTLLALVVLSSVTSFAQVSSIKSLKQTLIADCKLTISGNEAGTMKVLSSDNGDEGFLSFNIVSNVGYLTFTDNVQDDGAMFLKKNKSALYVSYQGAESKGLGKVRAAAVSLQNKNGVITGLLKADFFQADLSCLAVKAK